MEYPKNINMLLFAYALGVYTLTELIQILQGIGFSTVVVDILVAKAEWKKYQIEMDGA